MATVHSDPGAFFDAIGRDAEAFASTLDLFRTEGRAQCARVVLAARAHARGTLREALHKFAGSLVLLRARPALELVDCLRDLCDEDDDEALEAVAIDLEQEFQRVCDELVPVAAGYRRAAA
jgi:hypothetical protein